MSIIFNSSAITGNNQWQWKTTSGLTSVSTPRMTTNGLLVFLDAANPKSYVSGQTTWNDISGYGYHFNLTGTTTTRPTFSGSNYGYINFNQTATEFTWAERTPTFPRLTAYTVEMWVKFNSSVTGTSSVITTILPGSGNINFSIGWNNNSVPSQRLIFGGRFSSSWANTDSGFVPSLQEWYQLVLTYDGNGLQKLYLNSELYSSNTSATAANISGGIRIARRWDGLTTSTNMTNMSASVVRIYNRDLTQSEINNNYQSLYYRYYQNIPSINYILDSYPNAVVAYSLRKLKSSYTGYAIRLYTTNNNQSKDIGFDASGNLDTQSVYNFLSGGTYGLVTIWYDQSGNGNNATATTVTAPSVGYTSLPTYIGDKPSIFFGGAYTNSLTLTTRVLNARSVFMVVNPYDFDGNGSQFGGFLLGATPSPPGLGTLDYCAGQSGQWLATNGASYVYNGTNYLNGFASDFVFTYKRQTNYFRSYYVTMLHTSANGRFDTISQDRSTTYRSWYGRMSEIIVYSGDQTTNRLVIEKNISDYYSIFPI